MATNSRDRIEAAKSLLLDMQSWQEEFDFDCTEMLAMLVFFVGTAANGLGLDEETLSEVVAKVTPLMVKATLELSADEGEDGICGVGGCDNCGSGGGGDDEAGTPTESWRNEK